MDLTTILAALPTVGPIGVLLIILTYVGRQWLTSDTRYKLEIEGLTERHKAELERINAARDEEMKDLREDMLALKTEIAELRKELAVERQARMVAEENAHRYRIQSGTDIT